MKQKILNIWHAIVDWFRKDDILYEATKRNVGDTVLLQYKGVWYYAHLSSNSIIRGAFVGYDYVPGESLSVVFRDRSSMHPRLFKEAMIFDEKDDIVERWNETGHPNIILHDESPCSNPGPFYTTWGDQPGKVDDGDAMISGREKENVK